MRSSLIPILAICGLLVWKSTAKTCTSIELRNNVTSLEKLRNCTVIAGYLSILLIESSRLEDFDNYSFPELREVTEYVLFYRVHNLTSLGKLFPSLTVIRGQVLFSDYALVVYQLRDLVEVGLYSLSRIYRGGVRIEKNSKLCYVDSVNWNLISEYGLVRAMNGEPCPKSCPAFCKPAHCWSDKRCQAFISPTCHKECLHSCTGPRDDQCYVCRNYKQGNRCVSNCSSNTYLVAKFATCVSESECTSMEGKWWTFEGNCVDSCPPKYEEKDGICKLCESLCPKVCTPTDRTVNSLDSLQNLAGCTTINGSLHIRIGLDVNNIEEELEKNLGQIEEITDFLKIYRSIPIRSLKFLKSLRVIRGNKLEQNRHSIIIFENPNLQELWDWDNFQMNVMNGTFSFHYNPKLCPSEIKKLAELSNLKTNYTDNDVSLRSNGDKFSCTSLNITAKVVSIHQTNVTLEWDGIVVSEKEAFKGYLIYYMEMTNTSLTKSEEECEEKTWTAIFVSPDNDTQKFRKDISNLKAYTQYVFYVSTGYTGVSPLQSFTTLSGDPSVPRRLRAVAVGSDALRFSWERPDTTRGVLSHYNLIGFIQEDDQAFIDMRNYCNFKMVTELPKRNTAVATATNATIANRTNGNIFGGLMDPSIETDDTDTEANHTCSCNKDTHPSISLLDFDDICISDFGSYSYHITPSHKYHDDTNENMIVHKRKNEMNVSRRQEIIHNGVYLEFDKDADGLSTSFVVDKLKHYSTYIVLVKACNENRTVEPQCSSVVMVSQRTGRKSNADDIRSIHVLVVDVIHVDIMWSQPEHPNAVIVSYEIEYKNLDSDHSKPIIECITRRTHEQSGYRHRIMNLHPGKYHVRVRATSLAGPGNFTKYEYFTIVLPSQMSSVVSVVVALLILVVVAAVAVLYWRYKVRRTLDNMHLIANVNPDYSAYAGYVEDEWEIDQTNIELYQELGKGTFGLVYSGMIKNKHMPCAVKTVNDNATMHDKMEFLNEASVMKAFNDAHHVIRLMGVVSKGPRPLVVMELMARGDLKSFLRTTRDSSTSLTCCEMYRMAAEVADGMAYLSAKKFVHRDLAARNCMVSADRTVKIGDFGMTRDVYETDYYRKETRGLLPVRWMAPESLADGVFTSDSDVWSYGIVLWEIATLAEQPYQGLANEQVLQFVIAKGTLERPLQCPDLLYDIMEACWHWFPTSRPMFTDIVEKLESHVGQDFRLVSFYHSRDGEDYRMNKQEVNKARASHMSAMPQGRVAAHWSRDADAIHFHRQSTDNPLSSSAPRYDH